MPKSRLKWPWLAASVTVAAVAVGAWSLVPRGRALDPTVWQDEKQVVQGVRLAMADRIVAKNMLSGKTRAEVVAMLGEPPKTGYFTGWDLVYWLGPERGFISIDSEWLVVRFDAQGHVLEYRIVRD